jgi:glucosyl-3-phosphoglycerate synthase
MTERFLRLVNAHPEFQPFLEQGLSKAILAVEGRSEKSIFETPKTVSWERVASKLPNIYYDLIEVVENEKRRFSE